MPRKSAPAIRYASFGDTSIYDERDPSGFRLDGRVALITGATRGLGLEIARAFARAGAHVFINGRNRARCTEQVRALRRQGLSAEGAAFDVAERRGAQRAIDRIERLTGRLDILVNNVGLRDRRPMAVLDEQAFGRLLQVDLVAAYALCRRAAVGMVARRSGRIINVTSIAGQLARPGDPAYIAAKGGLDALTRALAADLGRYGVTCNAIAPGFFLTETNRPFARDRRIGLAYARRVPLQRWGEPREIGGAAVFLASAEASYVNGHTLVVDGGVSATYAMM